MKKIYRQSWRSRIPGIDGNDYWVWQAIGASLAAFCHLAEKKGYDFIGTAGAGVNAFFVRKDLSEPFIKYNAQTGFRASANRDSKDQNGNLSFLLHTQRLPVIKELPVTDVVSGKNHLIKELYEL